MRAVAGVVTGKRHVTVRVRDMCGATVGNLTLEGSTTMTQLREVAAKLKQGAAELFVQGAASSDASFVRINAVDGTTVAQVLQRLHQGAENELSSVLIVNVAHGKPHEIVTTAITQEHQRGDIDCPKCGKRGPHRYTGHRHCKVCACCMYCSAINPFCNPRPVVEDDDTDYVEPTEEEERLEEAAFERERAAVAAFVATPAGDAMQNEFYEWQRVFMKPDKNK